MQFLLTTILVSIDLKVCDDGTLVQILCFCTLSKTPSCLFCKTWRFGEWILSPKRCVLKNKQDGVFDKDKTMDNVQKHNICSYSLLKIESYITFQLWYNNYVPIWWRGLRDVSDAVLYECLMAGHIKYDNLCACRIWGFHSSGYGEFCLLGYITG
jgi:hypothetical protein